MPPEKRTRPRGNTSGSTETWKEIHSRIEALDRDRSQALSEEDLKDLWYRRALELSRPTEEGIDAKNKVKLVTFRLGSDRYGVRVGMVREIQRAEEITHVPMAPDFIAGIMNLRGNILSVVDIRVFFGLQKVTVGAKARVLVVEGGGLRMGIVVERIEEILDVSVDDIKPPLSLDRGIQEDCIQGIVTLRGEMLIMIDLEKVLTNPRLIVDEHV